MRFIDLFCGIGGFRLGLEKSNGKQQENTEIGGCGNSIGNQGKQPNQSEKWGNYTCVWSNDNDKYACQIYRKQFGEVYEQDIRTVDPSTIPKHDLLCAGFPCQSFSIAGKRRRFEDTRGTLFFEICRVIQAKRPKYLFLENVKGLLSHDDGATFQTIIRTLDELGYDCQWQVLNSKDYGVPQNRERVFILGHTRGQPRPKVFPVGGANQAYPESDEAGSQVPPAGQDIQSRDRHPKLASRNSRLNTTPDEDISTALDANYGKGWLDHGQRTMIHTAYPDLREYEDVSPTISTPSGGGHLPYVAQALRAEHHNTADVHYLPGIRRLTPLECERLQGFPDGWTEGISDTQRYKCLGNAVTVNVIEAIGGQLGKYEKQ